MSDTATEHESPRFTLGGGSISHERADRNCAFWDGTRSTFLARLILGIRCVICSNVGTALGTFVNQPQPERREPS